MAEMFLCMGQTKRLVLAPFSTPVLFLKLDGTATSQVHWDQGYVLLLLSTGTMECRLVHWDYLVHWDPLLYVQYI